MTAGASGCAGGAEKGAAGEKKGGERQAERRTEEIKKAGCNQAVCYYGAGDEARTRYLDLGKVALYQMSYTRGTFTL